MTPTLISLSRAYLALPGAPKQEHAGVVVATGLPLLGRRYRTPDGYLWKWDDETTQWLLELTDEATGGVLVSRFSAIAALDIRATRPTADAVRWWGYWLNDDSWRDVPPSDHLAEAVARAAVALGRAG